MTLNQIETVEKLIESHSDIVNFGTRQHAVNSNWVKKAEKAIGFNFTKSYLWFLQNYSGGEVGGEEIFSIYGEDFENIIGGDIVAQHLSNRVGNIIKPNELVILETDFGEIFFFDYDRYEGEECPIYLKLGTGEPKPYANNFYEFIEKRINVFIT